MPEQAKPRKAPAKKAAKTAPAKKAPAKKQAAKKAAAKKAPAVVTARESIQNRIAELEERISAEPPRTALPSEELAAEAPPKPVVRPAKKAPAKKAPAKKAPAKKAPAKTAPAKTVPAKKAATTGATNNAPTPVPTRARAVTPREAPPVALGTAEAPAPGPVVADLEGPPLHAQQVEQVLSPPRPTLVDRQPKVRDVRASGQGSGWRRAVVALIVLLLALAVGLAAAAVARDQPATWSSTSVVTLSAGPSASASAVPDGIARYRERAEGSSFTALAAFQAGLDQDDLRSLVQVKDGTPGQVVLEARATSRASAAKFAASAGRVLLLAVAADEAQVSDPEERLTAASTTPATDPEREIPTTRDVWLAGLLAALALLLVSAMAALLVMSRRPRPTKESQNSREV